MADIQEYSVSIKFKTEGSEKASKDANNVKDSISKLKSASAGFDGLKSGLGKLTNFTGKVAKGVKVAAVATGAALVKAGKTASKYSKEMMDYIETVNLFSASMGDLSNEAMKLVNRGEIELGLNPQEMMNAIASFQNLSEGFGIASDRAFIMSKNLAQLSGDLSSFANISYETAQKKLMSGFSGQVMPLRQYGIALDQASLQELAYSLGIEQKVKTMTRAQKTELIYYQIMKSTQKMQGDLGRTLMSPANALRVMQNEFKALARAVGSIFIPIMQRIIPIMRMVTKALTQAAQTIAKFFGFDIENYTADLGGVGSGLEGIADDVDDVGGAAEGTAKKLNKMLMPFDELNNMNSSDSSGSGGGAGSGGIGGGSLGIDLPQYDMFANINNQVETFGDILGKASEGAHRLNEALAGIDWDRIKEGAGAAGRGIAEFLNIGITEIDWKLVGTTFAEGLNTIIEAAYNFVTTFKWKEFGEAVGNLVNGFFENVNFEKLAETFNIGIQGVLDSIIEFLKTVKWEKIGEDIITFLTTLNYEGIAGKILELIGVAMTKNKELSDGLAKGIVKSISESITGQELEESDAKKIAKKFKGSFETAMLSILPGGKVVAGFKALGGEAITNFFKGIKEKSDEGKPITQGISESFINTFGETSIKIYKGIAYVIGKVITIWENFVNDYIIDGINQIIYGLNEIGVDIDQIDFVDWSDNYEEHVEKVVKDTEKGLEIIKKGTVEESAEMTKGTKKAWDILQSTYNSTLSGMETTTQESFGNMEQTTGIKTDAMKQAISKNLGESEQVTTIKTASILDKFSTTFENIKTKAQQNTSTIKNDTENNLGQIANSSVFSKIKDSFSRAFDNAQKARELGQATSSNFKDGILTNLAPDRISDFVSTNVRGAFDLKNSAYYWGSDMVEGYKNGIESKKGVLARVSETLAGVVSKYLHFSRPDEGPLRDYETWMPDMIKGLSDSLIKAAPVLDNTIEMISNRLADSLSNIELPDIENSLLVNQNATQLIGNIGNKTNAATKDNTTTNMIRATYEAVSRALADNTGNNDNRQIIVNVGNKELYRGYGKYQDEQSNMLGVNV